MSFYVGQKVVCVDASGDGYWAADVPVEGAIYTVTGCVRVARVDGLLLAEIRNDMCFRYAYAAWRFRPVVERKTDISIFTAMLGRKKIGVPA